MNKKFLSLILALALSASLTACGSSDTTETTDDTDSGDTAETVTLKVAASPTPHAEILEQVKPILAEQGIDLVITEYGDYIVPNTAVDEGDEDANYFQHTPYLEQFNAENGTDLVSAGKIHYEPMGAPQWGQNLLSDTAPQMGQAFSPETGSAASSLADLQASSSAILALEAVTASTSSRTASGISPSYSLTNHSPMVR